MYKNTGNMHTVQGLRIHVLQETQKPTIKGQGQLLTDSNILKKHDSTVSFQQATYKGCNVRKDKEKPCQHRKEFQIWTRGAYSLCLTNQARLTETKYFYHEFKLAIKHSLGRLAFPTENVWEVVEFVVLQRNCI